MPMGKVTVVTSVDEEESRRQAEETSKKGVDVFLAGGNSRTFSMFTLKIGEDEPILTSIFASDWW